MAKLVGFLNNNDDQFIEIPEKVFLIDGYNIGDRLLEGVMFEINFNEKDIIINVEKESKNYFSNLNEKKWLKEVRKQALFILNTGDEVEVPETIKTKYKAVAYGIIK